MKKSTTLVLAVTTLLFVAPFTSKAEDSKDKPMNETQTKSAERKKTGNLNWTTPAKPEWHTGPMNAYARGIQLMVNNQLAQKGEDPIPYEIISGDLGVAFAFHTSEVEVEAPGYWPHEPICLNRLNFLNQTVGYQFNHYSPEDIGGIRDPEQCYQKWFEPQVRSSIDSGKPCLLTLCPAVYLVTGYNTSNITFDGVPIGGNEEAGNHQIKPMPWKMVLPGKPTERMDRTAADLQALNHAVDLHHDRDKELAKWLRYTGLKAFENWIRVLSDDRKPHAKIGHGWLRDHLLWNRLTAIRYLQAIQSRQRGPVAQHLDNAIKHYEAVISQVRSLELDQEEHFEPAKRTETIAKIKEIMELESKAVAELQKAVDAFPDEMKS